MQDATRLVQESQRVLISGHLRADGDCLGAQSVLFHTFSAMGKEVRVINPDSPDGRYAFLHEHTPYEIYAGPGSLPPYDVMFVCDCSTLERLGRMGEEVLQLPGRRVALDHHILGDKDRATWHALIHDVEAPASGLLALRFAESLGVSLSLAAREAAFVSLATDTGWFKYSNAGPAAWSAASQLVESGVSAEKIFGAIYQRCDAGHPLGIAAGLAALEYHRGGRVALSWLAHSEMEARGASLADTDEVLDILRAVEGVEVVAFIHERVDGRVKASFRSKTEADVNLAARSLGGGGHKRAAGVTFDEGVSLQEAVDRVRGAAIAAVDGDLVHQP